MLKVNGITVTHSGHPRKTWWDSVREDMKDIGSAKRKLS